VKEKVLQQAAGLSRKDQLEAAYWAALDHAAQTRHKAKIPLYLWAFGHFTTPQSVLEIGPGPYDGVLRYLTTAKRRVGIDPNYNLYWQSLDADLANHSGDHIEYIAQHFEDWAPGPDDRFDAIFCMDCLDHGELGFQVLPKIHSLLNPGGKFYLHVNLRPEPLLNEIHDHPLTFEDFTHWVSRCPLFVDEAIVHPRDIDGNFDCPTLVAVMTSPAFWSPGKVG
jgi:SAM-dependent methyltransferase